MKKILIGLAVVVVLLLGVALIIPSFIDMNDYKGEISEQVHAATGRSLEIGGDIRLAVLPRLELELSDVSFGNAPGARTPEMATLSELDLELKLFPLLSGTIVIDSFVLVEPVINLEVDAEGSPNWVFDTGAPAEAESGEGGAPPLSDVRLGDVRIENGQVAYADAAGNSYVLSDIDMSVEMTDFGSPLAAKGSLVFNEQEITITVDVDTVSKLMAAAPTRVGLSIESALVELSFTGDVVVAEVPKLDGEVNLSVPSIRELAAWAGAPLEMPGTGLGPFRAKGEIAVDGRRITISGAEIALDEITSKGTMTVDLSAEKPTITADLETGVLVLDPYIPTPGGTEEAEPASEPADWSDEPIDVSALALANAEFAFRAEGIRVQNLEVGKSVLELHLADSNLVVTLKELALYGGNGTARIQLDGRSEVPRIAKTVSITKVQAEPLLSAAADFDRLSGTANIEFEVVGSGRSQREIVANLNGGGKVAFLNGAINGINLASMVRNIKSAFLDDAADEVQKTDFAELSGSFRITDGILRNDDLSMKAPLIRLSGAGTVDLPKRTLEYRVAPTAAATVEGQGGETDVVGITVPVIAEGALARPLVPA